MSLQTSDADGSRNPVLVLCSPRSCSTVFVAMLARHPALYGFPELRLFYGETLEAVLEPRWRAAGLTRAVAQLRFGGESEASIDDATKWLETLRTMKVAEMFDYLLGWISPRIGIEKTPDTIACEGQLDRALRIYPRARLIHLVRHPVPTIRSMMRFWGPLASDQDDLLRNCARHWYVAHRRAAEATARVAAGQAIRVSAEEIVRSADALAQVVRWLGFECDAQTLSGMRHPERWEYASWPPGPIWGAGDRSFLTSPQLREPANRLDEPLPQPWDLGDELRTAISQLASDFGYAT